MEKASQIAFNNCIKSFSYFQLFLIPRAIWLFFLCATHVDIWSEHIGKMPRLYKNHKCSSKVNLQVGLLYLQTHVDIWSEHIGKMPRLYKTTSVPLK